jgi:hypothetical protein
MPTLVSNFEPGLAQCSWRTIDFFAQEHPAVRENGLDAKIVLVVDNSRGSDAVLAKGEIKSAWKTWPATSVGLVQYTPSHMVLVHAIEQSLLTERKKQSIDHEVLATAACRRPARPSRVRPASTPPCCGSPTPASALKQVPGSPRWSTPPPRPRTSSTTPSSAIKKRDRQPAPRSIQALRRRLAGRASTSAEADNGQGHRRAQGHRADVRRAGRQVRGRGVHAAAVRAA